MISRRATALVLLAGVLAGAAALGTINVLNASYHRDNERLAMAGVLTKGTVTGSFPKEHGTIEYTFVDSVGRVHTGGGSVSGSNPRPEALAAGATIQIVYDPQNPDTSCACDPSENLVNEKGDNLGVALFAGFAGLVIAFGALAARNRRTAGDQTV